MATPPPTAPHPLALNTKPDVTRDDEASDGAAPKPPEFPYDTKVSVRAFLSPVCVTPGTVMRLTLRTTPEAAIAYNAVYSDGHGGGVPPFGRGYGGNDKGFASSSGRYSTEWLVARNAPHGPARVDVVVAHRGRWGYAALRFHVAAPSGDCSRRQP